MSNDTVKPESIPAGCFSSWLRRTRMSFIKEKGSVVNCGSCKGCCTSSYFIHIRPEEKQALSRINKKLLFPAPGLPKGNVLLGYFENGYCPMMINDRCSIYEDRPTTCRTYDCRIFTATGIAAGEEDKALINQRVREWAFSYPTPLDTEQQFAVIAAAKFLKDHGDSFPPGAVPNNPSQLAIQALKTYTVFLKCDGNTDYVDENAPHPEIAKAVMTAADRFKKQ